MGKGEKFQREEIGKPGCLNKKCWLVKTLNYSPYNRCQYCELEFRKCLFLHYQIISLILITFFFCFSFFIEGKVSELIIICIFTLVIVYGYFLNKSTDKIIKANFAQREAKMALEKLTEKLEERVDEQTKDLKQKSKYLQELLNMKSDFLRVVNHQLNTPLSVLNSSFSMIKEKSIDPRQGIKIAASGLSRINQTVSDFWDAYELEGERMKMNPGKVDITAIVNKFISEKKKFKLARDRGLQLMVKKPNSKIPIVWCDSKKIAHVISNLLDNAVFYTPKGSITISYELIDDNFLKIDVKDTGAGISAEDKQMLFQKFSRGIGASTLHPDGSGLGLYIAKKIVEGNGGKMTFTSEGLGKGSTFSLTVPIYKNQKISLKKQEEKEIGVRKKVTIFEKNL